MFIKHGFTELISINYRLHTSGSITQSVKGRDCSYFEGYVCFLVLPFQQKYTTYFFCKNMRVENQTMLQCSYNSCNNTSKLACYKTQQIFYENLTLWELEKPEDIDIENQTIPPRQKSSYINFKSLTE